MTEAFAEPAAGNRVPAWYWLVAVAALLFELSGAYLLANSLTLEPSKLPLDQRAVFEATPQWMIYAWAIAVATGLIGTVGLILRRRWSEPLLLFSLLAALAQFSGIVLQRELRELTPEEHLIVPVVILLLAYGIWQMAKLARRRGWLA